LVCGHSIGEYMAAHVAGVMGLEEALGLVVTRGRLMQELGGQGAMASVFCSEEEVVEKLGESRGRVWIAAENAAREVVISGEAMEVKAAVERLREKEWGPRFWRCRTRFTPG